MKPFSAVPFVGSFLFSSLETVYFFVFVGCKKSGNLTKSRVTYAFIGNLNPFWSKLNPFWWNKTRQDDQTNNLWLCFFFLVTSLSSVLFSLAGLAFSFFFGDVFELLCCLLPPPSSLLPPPSSFLCREQLSFALTLAFGCCPLPYFLCLCLCPWP